MRASGVLGLRRKVLETLSTGSQAPRLKSFIHDPAEPIQGSRRFADGFFGHVDFGL